MNFAVIADQKLEESEKLGKYLDLIRKNKGISTMKITYVSIVLVVLQATWKSITAEELKVEKGDNPDATISERIKFPLLSQRILNNNSNSLANMLKEAEIGWKIEIM